MQVLTKIEISYKLIFRKEMGKLLALYYTAVWIVFVVIMWAIAAYFRIDAIREFFNSPSFSWLFR